MKKLKIGSLFAGIGGLELGFEWQGNFETVWQVERDSYACKVLEKHWPNVPRHDDVCTFPVADFDCSCDVLTAGFPCQDISYAGLGAGLKGERSGLFYEVVRIIREVGPRFAVLENVSALLSRGMGDVLGSLASIGYDATWHCLPASAVGAPHQRDRIFIICHANGDGESTGAEHVKKESWVPQHLADAIGERCNENAVGFAIKGGAAGSSTEFSNEGSETGTSEKCSDAQRERREKSAEESPLGKRSIQTQLERMVPRLSDQWAIEPEVGRVADGVSRRVDRLRCLGNAVVPQVAEVIAEMVWRWHLKTIDT